MTGSSNRMPRISKKMPYIGQAFGRSCALSHFVNIEEIIFDIQTRWSRKTKTVLLQETATI